MSERGKLFKIVYRNPDSDQDVEVEKEFSDTETVSAEDWARDWAYSMADKGPFTVIPIKQ